MAFLARRAAGPCVSPCSTRHSSGAATRPSRSSGCSEPIIKRRSTKVIREPLTTASNVGVMDLPDVAGAIACCRELKDKLQRMPGPADEEPLKEITHCMHDLAEFLSSTGSAEHDPAEMRDQRGNMQEALDPVVTTASSPRQLVLQLGQAIEQLAEHHSKLQQLDEQRREQVQQLQYQVEQQQQRIQHLERQDGQQYQLLLQNLDEYGVLALWGDVLEEFWEVVVREVQRKYVGVDWGDVYEYLEAEEGLPASEQRMTTTVKAALLRMGLTWEEWEQLRQVASEVYGLTRDQVPSLRARDPAEMLQRLNVDAMVVPQHLEYARGALRKMAQIMISPRPVLSLRAC